jgi:hypothetical protein
MGRKSAVALVAASCVILFCGGALADDSPPGPDPAPAPQPKPDPALRSAPARREAPVSTPRPTVAESAPAPPAPAYTPPPASPPSSAPAPASEPRQATRSEDSRAAALHVARARAAEQETRRRAAALKTSVAFRAALALLQAPAPERRNRDTLSSKVDRRAPAVANSARFPLSTVSADYRDDGTRTIILALFACAAVLLGYAWLGPSRTASSRLAVFADLRQPLGVVGVAILGSAVALLVIFGA